MKIFIYTCTHERTHTHMHRHTHIYKCIFKEKIWKPNNERPNRLQSREVFLRYSIYTRSSETINQHRLELSCGNAFLQTLTADLFKTKMEVFVEC